MSQSKEQLQLRKEWDRWIGVVKSIECRNKLQMSDRRYNILYRQLLDACGADGEDESQEATPETGIRCTIRELVKPWVSIETLRHSDRTILRNLLLQSRSVDHVMHPHMIRVPWLLAYLLIGVFVAACLVGAVLYSTGEIAVIESVRSLTDHSLQRLRLIVGRITLTQWLGVVAVMVVVFGIGLTRGIRNS